MASLTPYTYIQCPCVTAAQSDDASSPRSRSHSSSAITTGLVPFSSFDNSSSNNNSGSAGGGSGSGGGAGGGPAGSSSSKVKQQQQQQAAASSSDMLDPRAARSSYGLYPLEHLLYCENCNQIRCPRCVTEEVLTVFCPNCLFEVPNTNLRTEGNRCTRNCFQCPICVGPLVVSSLDPPPDPSLLGSSNAHQAAGAGSFVLSCTYCQWSSAEIGIRFDKANGIYSQLARVRNGGTPRPSPRDLRDPRRKDSLLTSMLQPPPGDPSSTTLPPLVEAPTSPDDGQQPQQQSLQPQQESGLASADLDVDLHFSALQTFYRNQLAVSAEKASGTFSSLAGDLNLSSPASFSRLMSLYSTGRGLASLAKKNQKQALTMREACTPEEGLKAAALDESAAIDRLLRGKWEDTVTVEQNADQVGTGCVGGSQTLRFQDSLRPVPCLLRAKRSRRCHMCRHIITKPENKVVNTRYRIRLVAASYIPTISIRPMPPPPPSTVVGTPGGPASAPAASSTTAVASNILRPMKPTQFILKFRNPIFEKVRVKLATPRKTPGRFSAEVTLLCHEFHIDANTDMWEDAQDALKQGDKRASGRPDDAALQQGGGMDKYEVPYERARNWVSIVIEVKPDPMAIGGKGPTDLKEDEDVLEIPIYVRLEWEAEGQGDVGGSLDKDKEGKETRGLEYWCVLGVGRIVQD